MNASDPILTKGLPVSLDAERFVLGSVLAGYADFSALVGALDANDFSLEKHRRIFARMLELEDRGEKIDRITLANELMKHNQLESCDGLAYLVSLDDGLPRIHNLDSYVRILREKATLRRTIFGAQKLIDRCLMAEDGAEQILLEAEGFLASVRESGTKRSSWYSPAEIIENYPGGLNAFLQPSRGGYGLTTPWPAVDRSLCGLQPGDLIVLAGRPGMGKSICACQLAEWVARHGTGVAFISLEMSRESLVRRLIAAGSRVDHQRVRTGCLNADERRRVNLVAAELARQPLYIDESRARTIPAQVAAIRQLAAQHPIGLVIIDHLQLMKGATRAEKRYQELGDISHSFKHLAGDRRIPVVVVSQLNRECEIEHRRPQLSDLRECGDLEQDADVVWFIHRPERYAKNTQREDLRGRAEFIIAKQRNGPTGQIDVVFLAPLQKFESMTKDVEREPAGQEEIPF